MRLNLGKKFRVISIFLKNELNFVKKRYQVLRQLCANEDIIASEKKISKILKKWFKTAIFTASNIRNKYSIFLS